MRILSLFIWAFLLIPLVWSCFEFDQLIDSSYSECFSGQSSYSSEIREYCLDGYHVLEEEFLEEDFNCMFKGFIIYSKNRF